jgi:hypothetical protein
MTPDIADCAGLWRRTLLVDADGSRDTTTDVRWLQGITAYVDSRGFAGSLGQRGDVFEWARSIEVQPADLPDAGRMSWDGDILVEVGVHADYVEHWVRDQAPASPCWALTLSAGAADEALLLRVGRFFGWACRIDGRAEVVVGEVDGPDWTELGANTHGSELHVNGVRWSIKESEGSVEL